jgi:hypothetical protein
MFIVADSVLTTDYTLKTASRHRNFGLIGSFCSNA